MTKINPYESIPERLHNCPNCGGTLNEAGRCSFCGSKVYDFLSINFDHTYRPSAKTYIRIKSGGKIILAPVIVNNACINTHANDVEASFLGERSSYYISAPPSIDIELDLAVVGDLVQVDDVGG